VFSRARWCFRQCAWPARRRARKNHWRARERAAMRQGRFAMKVRGEMISDVRFEISDLGAG